MDYHDSLDPMKIEDIFNLLKKEIQLGNTLQYIQPDFYQKICHVIFILKEEQTQNEDSKLSTGKDEKNKKIVKQINSNLINMIIRLTTLLFIYRCKKIFNSSKSSDNFDYSNLTDEEKYIFFGNRERDQRINIILKMLFEGKSKTLEKIVSSINNNIVILRFLDSMEQFVGVNMNKYGPFEKDDIAILPFENARSIIENNKAVEIYRIN